MANPGASRELSALAGLFRYRVLVQNLVLKDLKLKYRDSLLGVLWSLLNPLLTLAVYTFAFHTILRVQMQGYAWFLLVSLLPWNFFSASLYASTGSILQNAHLIRKVYFPREVLPVATVLFWFAQLLLALSVFVPLLMASSILRVRWTFLLAVPLLLLHVLFTIGLALALSALTTWFRDLTHLTEVALLLLFWVTPVVYPVTMAPPWMQTLLSASPLAAFSIAYQDLLFFGRTPGAVVLLSVLLYPVVSLLGGLAIFRRYSPSFAERV